MKKKKSQFHNNGILALIIIILFTLLSSSYLYRLNYIKDKSPWIAENGYLDLSSWNMADTIDLDGQWEFYPHVLIDPESENFDDSVNIRKHVLVPGSWESYLNDGENTEGSGTYRLLLTLPKDQIYGIKARTIRLANNIFINGEKIISTGNPSLDTKYFTPESRYKLGFANSIDREIELVIQVSSYSYHSGGIIKSIEFGSDKSILNVDRKDMATDIIVVSLCILFGLYFILTFFHRRKDKYVLYFGLLSLSMGIYLSTMNEQIISYLIPYSPIIRARIQMISMIITSLLVLRFTHDFFKRNLKDRIVKIITIALGLSLLTIFFTLKEEEFLSSFNKVQQLVLSAILINYIYVEYILLKMIYIKADSLVYIVTITSSLSTYWISMIGKIILEIDLGYLPAILIFIMMVTVSLLMSYRQQLDYNEVISLSNRLITYDRTKNKFLSKVSKELKEPIENTMVKIDKLLEGKIGLLNEGQQKELLNISFSGRKLNRMLEDILNASQLDESMISLNLDEIDVYRIIEELLQEMRLLIPKNKNIVLINEVPVNFPRMKVDVEKFSNIISHLIHNGIKFTESGQVTILAYLDKREAIFEIKDTGLGISPTEEEYIFDVFYQDDKGQGYETGLGIGLGIVKNLVELHRGELELKSRVKKGSTFRFSIPMNLGDDIERNEVLENTNELSREVEKGTILLLLRHAEEDGIKWDDFSKLGFNIVRIEKGQDSIAMLKKEKIDLIIMDLNLGDMSGDEICRDIRQEYSIIELPILLLTSPGENKDLLNILDCGANDCIRRPINMGELKTKIESMLLMKSTAQESIDKELRYFYSQISPHFLYNTINTIIGLSYRDANLSRKALEDFSVYLRGKLILHKNVSLVTLESELDLVKAYLDIEKIRYGDRLDIEYDIDEDINTLIPPLTLQPLVENAIGHGLAKKKEGGALKISVVKDSENINIVIEDNGIGMSEEEQKRLLEGNNQRIGFKNIVKKLKVIKGSSIEIDAKPGHGSKITIKLKGGSHD